MMKRALCALFTCLLWVSPAFAETYWLPRVQYLPTEIIYTYELKVPEFFKPWLLESTPAGGGQVVTKTINGQTYTFVQQFFSWDTGGSSPANTGQIRIDDAMQRYQSNRWKDDAALKNDTAVIAGLDAFVLPRERNERWHSADVLALRSDSDQPPGLTFSEPVPEGEQIKTRMWQIAESTIPGQFFPNEVQMPADIAAMRREMLAWGNLGRRDPTFRKNNTWANDFSANTVQTGQNTFETLYKTNQQPPYFNDLVLHPQLNEACQFMAEYYAKTNANAQMPPGRKHDAPGVTYQGADMSTVGARLKYFAPDVGSSGEGLGGGGPADAYPEGWMRSETHYRPWFNIDFDNKSVGLGAAKTSNGWFFCMLGGTELPEGDATAMNPTPQPVAQYAGDVVPEGDAIVQGQQYWSGNRQFFFVFQSDGNLVVRKADGSYHWGIDKLPGYKNAKNAELGTDRRLVLSDEQTNILFQTNHPAQQGPAVLRVTDDGQLSVTVDSASGPMDTIVDFARRAMPIAPGQAIEINRQYHSATGGHLLRLQTDRNMVVATVPENQFVWGLNLISELKFGDGANVLMRTDGTLAVEDAAGRTMWAAPATGAVPGSVLDLTPDGALVVRRPDGSIAWSSKS